MDKFILKSLPLTQGMQEKEVVFCTVTNKSYIFTNKELRLMESSRNNLMMFKDSMLKNYELASSYGNDDIKDFYWQVLKEIIQFESECETHKEG